MKRSEQLIKRLNAAKRLAQTTRERYSAPSASCRRWSNAPYAKPTAQLRRPNSKSGCQPSTRRTEMPKRTLREARLALEMDILPRANDSTARGFTEALEAAENHAKDFAADHVASQADAIDEAIKATERDLSEVRDGCETLERDSIELTPREYTTRMNDLRAKETQANNDLELLQNRIDTLSAVESDPIAFFDRVTPPIARTEFPW